jgi:hypothetical protein
MLMLLLMAVLALGCSPAIAQRGFGGGHFGGRFSGRFASHHGGGYGRYGQWGGYPFAPLWWDSLYPDDFTDSEYPAPAPPVVVVQQPPAAPAAAPQPKPIEPLLIELRDGRYVQVSGPQNSGEEIADQQPAQQVSGSRKIDTTQASVTLPSTLLVFRNGSREQISDYTIADGVLYAETNYYTEGSWNKEIALSSLNLPATIDANRARGVRFQLPAAPNQVIVGP